MGIKKLKKENEFLNVTIADILGSFDTSKTKKYSQFLIKMLNQRIGAYNKDMSMEINEDRASTNPLDKVLPNGSWENNLKRNFVCDYIFSWGNMERFVEFTELMEKGLVKENDISKYDSWEMLETNLFEAKNREMFKKSKKHIHKIFEDDNYFIFKPLTYLSSCSYGYQTKWCTAMINDAGYFYNHSKGVLIYLIDKKDNRKFAFFKHIPDAYNRYEDDHEQYAFKTYNQEDKQIDTIQTGLPMNILQIILMECDTKIPTTVPNYKLFSEDEKNEMRKHTGPLLDDEDLGGEEMTVSDELPGLLRPMTVVPRLRRTARLIPMPALERRIEEINQHYQIHGNEGFEEISYETVGDILPYINEGESLEEKVSECLQDLKKLIDELP
jgi:hypothetical protein